MLLLKFNVFTFEILEDATIVLMKPAENEIMQTGNGWFFI